MRGLGLRQPFPQLCQLDPQLGLSPPYVIGDAGTVSQLGQLAAGGRHHRTELLDRLARPRGSAGTITEVHQLGPQLGDLGCTDLGLGELGRTDLGARHLGPGLGQPGLGVGQPGPGVGQPGLGVGQPGPGVGQLGPQARKLGPQFLHQSAQVGQLVSRRGRSLVWGCHRVGPLGHRR